MDGLTDLTELRRAYDALRDAEDRVYGPRVRVHHMGRCGAELNAVIAAVDAVLFGPACDRLDFGERPGGSRTVLIKDAMDADRTALAELREAVRLFDMFAREKGSPPQRFYDDVLTAALTLGRLPPQEMTHAVGV